VDKIGREEIRANQEDSYPRISQSGIDRRFPFQGLFNEKKTL
jgi:hypothetical protein